MKRSVKLGWVLAFVAASFVTATVTQAKEIVPGTGLSLFGFLLQP